MSTRGRLFFLFKACNNPSPFLSVSLLPILDTNHNNRILLANVFYGIDEKYDETKSIFYTTKIVVVV